jgi:hypothetical protein
MFLPWKGELLLQRLQFGDWIIDIDKESTRKYYENIIVSSECQCLYCKNYREVCNILTSQVIDFFDNLGIIPQREGEFAEVTIDDKNHMYTGFYHLAGNIIQGPTNVAQNWRNINLIVIDNFKFGFSQEAKMVPRNFPKPVIQLEFETTLPWLLNENP